MKTLLGFLKRTWKKQSPDTKVKLILFGPIAVAVLVAFIAAVLTDTSVSKSASSVSKPVTREQQDRENARIMKLVDDYQAKHRSEEQPVPPRIVRINVQCDSCQSYGKSAADAITTALQQSDKFDYAYFDMLVDTHVVVAERDGSVYVDFVDWDWYAAHESEHSDVSQIERCA